MSTGLFEARITLEGVTSFQFFENGALVTAIGINPGEYYLSTPAPGGVNSLFQAMANEMTAAGAGTYTVSYDPSNCKAQIQSVGVGNFGITWATTSLRDLLGFSANIVGQTLALGDGCVRAAWRPFACPLTRGDMSKGWRGWHETDLNQTESTRGDVFSISGERKIIASMEFEAVLGCRTWVRQEKEVNESFERFYLDYIYGAGPSSTPGGPLRWYPDIDANISNYGTYKVLNMKDWNPDFVVRGWSGLYKISLPRLVLMPDEVQGATL